VRPATFFVGLSFIDRRIGRHRFRSLDRGITPTFMRGVVNSIPREVVIIYMMFVRSFVKCLRRKRERIVNDKEKNSQFRSSDLERRPRISAKMRGPMAVKGNKKRVAQRNSTSMNCKRSGPRK
jgi:hypothetical protein